MGGHGLSLGLGGYLYDKIVKEPKKMKQELQNMKKFERARTDEANKRAEDERRRRRMLLLQPNMQERLDEARGRTTLGV